MALGGEPMADDFMAADSGMTSNGVSFLALKSKSRPKMALRLACRHDHSPTRSPYSLVRVSVPMCRPKQDEGD